MAPPAAPPISLFPGAPPVKLVINAALQVALTEAVVRVVAAVGKPASFGITIVDFNSASAGGNAFASAGYNYQTEHYAGSMLKAACLYAAHALRDLVQRFARARQPKDSSALFPLLNAELNPQISVCCPMLKGLAGGVLLPRWTDVFTASGTGAGMTVTFTPGYTTSLKKMIVPSDNVEAGRCIRGVGYAYLNGLLLNHGFFDASSKTGIWLAGDYGQSPVVTIPCDNDVNTKQGTTTEMMARLGSVILLGKVLPGASHGEMLDLLDKSSHGTDGSYFSRPAFNNHLTAAQVTHGKIGYGDLKKSTRVAPSGGLVYVLADLNVISDPIGKGGRFVVCYTNVDQISYYVGHVLWTFREAMRIYQSAAPAAAAAPAAGPAVGASATP
jgi:hypothetical protein